MIFQDILNRNKIKIKLYNKDLYVKKMTLEDVSKMFFLLVPYIKLIKEAKSQYQNNNTIADFKFMMDVLISELDNEVLYEIFSLLYGGTNKNILMGMDVKELTRNILVLIKENNLIELYILFKSLGLYNG